jgi:membrane-associated phospholipid phosphatase
MKEFFREYVEHVRALFSWRSLALVGVAVISTAYLVFSGEDWRYLVAVENTIPMPLLFVADITGFLLPILLPLTLYIVAHVKKSDVMYFYARAVMQCVVLGFTLSTLIKIFTGRTSPPRHHDGVGHVFVDNSHDFHFGFFREQVIGGWPSSHATIVCALATLLLLTLPPRWYMRLLIPALATFITIGVTFGFHWLSESIAGACLGAAIGSTVGVYYREKLQERMLL